MNVGERLVIRSTLEVNPLGNDIYAWYKDGLLIEGATSNVFRKENVTLEDEGVYTYEVINTLIDELTLQSHYASEGITVHVSNRLGDVIDNVNKSIGNPISITLLEENEMAFYEISTLKIEGTSTFGDALKVENEGTWSLDDNKIIFTPLASFEGMPTAVFYTVENNEGITLDPIKVSINYKVMDANRSISIDFLENETQENNVDSIEIMLPEGFMEAHSQAFLSEDKQSLIVNNEGVWEVENNTMMTFTAEEGFIGKPSNISYLMLNKGGNKSTVGIIAMKDEVTENRRMNESNNVSALSPSGLILLMLLSGLFGMFYARKIN